MTTEPPAAPYVAEAPPVRQSLGIEEMKETKPKVQRDITTEDLWSDANHNPLVLENCPECSGCGKTGRFRGEGNAQIHELLICPSCNGTKTTGRIIRCFQDEQPIAKVKPDKDGWLTCPKCKKKFTTHDRHRWSGLRHMSCGQQIDIYAQSGPRD